MILSDAYIRQFIALGDIVVDPKPHDNQYQPASLEVTLGPKFVFPWEDKDERNWTDCAIWPGQFVLGTTLEHIELPNYIVAQINGKSSWARRGLQVHATAGFIDPGFKGEITLEMYNMSYKPIWLQPGMEIAQLVFTYMTGVADRPYGHPELGSHYQNQIGPTRARVDKPLFGKGSKGDGSTEEPLSGL